MKNYCFILLLLIPQMNFANPDGPAMEDFAYAYKIISDEDAAIYKLSLSKKIYDTVVRDDLGDIRIFNQDKIAIPHAIRLPVEEKKKNIIKLNLNFFPIFNNEQQNLLSDQFNISIKKNGAIVQIKSNERNPENQNLNSGYIIDASQIKHSIDEFKFEIENDQSGFIKNIKLDYSNDLDHWLNLLPRVTLAKLNYDSHELVKDTIKLPAKKAKYYRLTWLDKNRDIKIKTIQAHLSSSNFSYKVEWTSVKGRQSSEDEYIYEYDTGGAFSVHQIDIEFQENNTLINTQIRSRKSEEYNWHTQYSGLLYKLNVNEQAIKNNPISIRQNKHRHWQLVIKSQDDFSHAPPDLKFSWSANDLYFLARGQGPYTLAFGNGKAKNPGKPINTLMNLLSNDEENQFTATATLANEIILRGEEALTPERIIPWQRILLWGILIIAVCVLVFMAFRLFRQINQTQA